MPKKIPAITEVQVKNAKPQDKAFKLADGGGLYLEVLPSGGKSWRLKYRFGGQEKRLVFGLWPDVSLRQARQLREDARALVAEGVDPGEKRKQDTLAEAESQAIQAATFELVAREWHSKQRIAWTEKTAKQILDRLERHIFPHMGELPITQISAPELLAVLQKLEEWGKHHTAQRLRQYCEAVFAYAIATGKAGRNVGADLRGILAPSKTSGRAAIVEPRAIGGLLRAIDGYGDEGSLVTLAALKLAPLVFVRPGELRQAEWSEIDLDADGGPRWTIPAEKMKMRASHIVPLSRQAVEIIKGLHPLTGAGRYLFPNHWGGGRCMSEMTLTGALRRMGFGHEVMTVHGFRAMASTLLNEQGWASDVIERQLAHAPRNKVRAAYNRAEHLPERRRMMQAWADYLDGLKAGGKIIPIHRESNG